MPTLRMLARRMLAGAIGAAALLAAAPAGAEQPPVERLLGMIPDALVATGSPIFSYADYRQILQLGGQAARSNDPRASMPAILRARFGPNSLLTGFLHLAETPQVLGFGWPDIDQALEFGAPPDQVTILSGGPGLSDRHALGPALEARGFALDQVAGWPVWWRGDDHAIDLAHVEPGDFLGGPMGQASRIAASSGLLIRSAAWPTLRTLLAQQAGKGTPSQTAPMLQAAAAAAAAIPGIDGPVLQATAFWLADALPVRDVSGLVGTDTPLADAADQLSQPADPGPALPPFLFVLIADLQAGDTSVVALVLGYPSAAAADTAGAVLADRLAAWAPLTRAVTIHHAVMPGAGAAAELAVIDIRDPAPPPDSRPGDLLEIITRALYSRAFTPLAVP